MKHGARPAPEDQQWFRRVLGQFPTGITAITATVGAEPVGMVVGSFTSVSLDPPLVAFLPSKTSTTWPRIEAAGSFCVNVLGTDQEEVCHALMAKDPDAFTRLGWTTETCTGAPALTDAVAWIDCRVAQVVDAGDHWLVIGEVVDLDVGRPQTPLIFFRGGYGRFEAGTRVATRIDLGAHLHALNRVRPAMERLAAELDCECVAVAQVGDEFSLIASAGRAHGWDFPSRVGERVPAVAPFGRSIMAWASEEQVERWLAPLTEPAQAEECRRLLEIIRARGYSVTIRPEAPGAPDGPADDLRTVLDPGTELRTGSVEGEPASVAVPVLDADGHPLFALAVYGFASLDAAGLHRVAERLFAIAATGGSTPSPQDAVSAGSARR